MNLEEQILVNKYGQGLIDVTQLSAFFNPLNVPQKRAFLDAIHNLILQSKPVDDDIEMSIMNSGLRPTFTPCVLLRKGVANHNITRIIQLPEDELDKVLLLLLSLFKVAYNRRFKLEMNSPHKWWYSDLSNSENVKNILNEYS